MTLILPPALAGALWAHAERDAPRECVGALGGRARPDLGPDVAEVAALYPLTNIAADPRGTYLADPGHLLRALRAMRAGGLSLVALYHSHPRGPARPSEADTRQAAYPVPYLIADLSTRTLKAYLLPEGAPVPIVPEAPGG